MDTRKKFSKVEKKSLDSDLRLLYQDIPSIQIFSLTILIKQIQQYVGGFFDRLPKIFVFDRF